MARRSNTRGRYLDRKYPRIRYDFDRWGWVRLQLMERAGEAVQATGARAATARETWRSAWSEAGRTLAELREAGEQIAEPLDAVPAVRPADAQWA